MAPGLSVYREFLSIARADKNSALARAARFVARHFSFSGAHGPFRSQLAVRFDSVLASRAWHQVISEKWTHWPHRPYAYTRTLISGSFMLGLGLRLDRVVPRGSPAALFLASISGHARRIAPLVRSLEVPFSAMFGGPLFFPRFTRFRNDTVVTRFDSDLYMRTRVSRNAGIVIAGGYWRFKAIPRGTESLNSGCNLYLCLGIGFAMPEAIQPSGAAFENAEELVYEAEFFPVLC